MLLLSHPPRIYSGGQPTPCYAFLGPMPKLNAKKSHLHCYSSLLLAVDDGVYRGQVKRGHILEAVALQQFLKVSGGQEFAP